MSCGLLEAALFGASHPIPCACWHEAARTYMFCMRNMYADMRCTHMVKFVGQVVDCDRSGVMIHVIMVSCFNYLVDVELFRVCLA